ncbi:MAG TPA: hypothetical protein VF972_11365 [Actinomycetota bacterium]
MSAADWYLGLYSVGVGISVVGFWGWVIATGRLASLGAGRDDFGWHAAAEITAGGLLLAAGIGLFAARHAAWPGVLEAVGLGALVYALVESAGHYLARGNRLMAATVVVGWVFTIPALILRFTG